MSTVAPTVDAGNVRTSHPGGGGRNVGIVDNRSDVRDFLASRRARITPERAGLPAFGANRRVPGLRREEVALLAGVSVDYYTRLERGHLNGVSDSVLESLAGALSLMRRSGRTYGIWPVRRTRRGAVIAGPASSWSGQGCNGSSMR